MRSPQAQKLPATAPSSDAATTSPSFTQRNSERLDINDGKSEHYDIKHTKPDHPYPEPDVTAHLVTLSQRVLTGALYWLLDLLSLTLTNIKKPLSYLVSFWILLVSLDALRNGLASLATTALAPVCAIPGASWVVPFCSSSEGPSLCSNPAIRAAAPLLCSDYSASKSKDPDLMIDELMNVQDKIGQILDKKSEVAGLPYDMTRSNGALMNLRNLVTWSDLPSREAIGLQLDKYITLTEGVVDDLTEFSLQCSSLVDGVIILNRYTLDRVEQLAAKEERLQSSFSLQLSTWVSRMLFPFSTETTEDKIVDKYMDHMSQAIEGVDTVIEQAVHLNAKLKQGRHQLGGVQRLTALESDKIKADSEDYLEFLWNVVKGVAPQSRNLSKQLPLLQEINAQRELALSRTEMLVHDLSVIRGNLKELKSKMAVPGHHVGFSLRYHVATISNAAMNLEAVRLKASAEEDERRDKARFGYGLSRHGMFIEPS